MPIEHHPLVREFPEYAQVIAQLKSGDLVFRELFDEYHELDEKIFNIDEDITPVADHYAEELKKRRVFLKDKLYRMLVDAGSA
jgi:uncharacterized protein YdcH (DUF465 family)